MMYWMMKSVMRLCRRSPVELTIEEEDKEHLHLPLLVSSRCVSSEFPTRLCSKALQ